MGGGGGGKVEGRENDTVLDPSTVSGVKLKVAASSFPSRTVLLFVKTMQRCIRNTLNCHCQTYPRPPTTPTSAPHPFFLFLFF